MSMMNDGATMTMPVAPVSNSNSGGYGWGGDLIIALIMLFLFPMMYGGGMFGGMGGWGNGGMVAAANGALTRADLCSEFNFNNLENAVRGVSQGLCDGFYAMQNSINGLGMNVMQGFHGVDNAVCQLGYQTQQGFNATQTAMMQGNSALQAQLSQCCCETQRLMERGFCDTNYAQATNTTAIIQNAHNDTDRVLAKLEAIESSRKDEKISALQQELQTARFQASQTAQNGFIDAVGNSIVAQLRAPQPQPAYVVPNPNCCYGNPQVAFGSGCGCAA